jgi:hypothetical protein
MTMNRLKVAASAFALAAVVLTTTSSALAADGEPGPETPPAGDEASERFDRGLALFDEGDFVASLAEFRRAYAVKPVYKLRYNIGNVCLELHDYACAMQELTAYLAQGGDSIATERREAVTKLVARASSRVAKVEIVSTPGAEIFIDDQVVGVAPLKAPIVVNAGRRKVTSQKDGFTSKTIVVEAPGTDSLRVVVDLQPLHVIGAPSAAFAPSPKTPSRFTTASFIGLGVGGALLATAVAVGAVAQSERNDIQRQRFVGPNAPESMRSDADHADALALTANIVGAAGIVTLGATLGITLLRPMPASGGSPRLGLSFGPKGGGVHGTF